jgi:hypothetical protein
MVKGERRSWFVRACRRGRVGGGYSCKQVCVWWVERDRRTQGRRECAAASAAMTGEPGRGLCVQAGERTREGMCRVRV